MAEGFWRVFWTREVGEGTAGRHFLFVYKGSTFFRNGKLCMFNSEKSFIRVQRLLCLCPFVIPYGGAALCGVHAVGQGVGMGKTLFCSSSQCMI